MTTEHPQPGALSDCPIELKCSMHRAGTQWLAAGDRESLRAHLDVFHVLRRRAWRGCTCDLYLRLQRFLGVIRG